MGNAVLFCWEDSSALKHHCGFCERPLSHPGARSSCFGVHAEPCHRFHQAMFMRNRAHMCAMCNGADEAHHKRHLEIAERVRGIYDFCGEEWPIIPSPEPERGRTRARRSGDDYERSSTSGASMQTRKERKEQKRLTRAASRPKVITQDEIKYIDSVLHPAIPAESSGADPSNTEEIEEIERNLRYHAHVYSTGSKRKLIKELARIPDADVDFEYEMDRILEVLRVMELMKRNSRNRGLVGKDLKSFENLVVELKLRIVDDLVLVKKEEMEIRMRRAGYLRYVNRASFDIVEERYADKNWKTGEKIAPTTSSGSGTLTEEDLRVVDEASGGYTAEPSSSRAPVPTAADRRHLWQGHKEVGSDGELKDVIVRTHLSRSEPHDASRKRPAPLTLVLKEKPISNRIARPVQFTRPSGIPTPFPDHMYTRLPNNKHQSLQPTAGAWGQSPWKLLADSRANTSGYSTGASDEKHANGTFPPLLPAPKRENQRPIAVNAQQTSQPIQSTPFLIAPTSDIVLPELAGSPTATHPPISQKKAKKTVREAKRKAKRAAEKDEIDLSRKDSKTKTSTNGAEASEREDSVLSSEALRTTSAAESESDENKEGLASEALGTETETTHEIETNTPCAIGKLQAGSSLSSSARAAVTLLPDGQPSSPTPPVTSYGHHKDWKKFERFILVDALSDPAYTASLAVSCANNVTCVFENNSVLDCPFHAPHCPCCDPLADNVYLIYPSPEPYSNGPYNRLRAQRLLAKYEAHPQTKGRLMLVDNDLVKWFYLEPNQRRLDPVTGPSKDTPSRLAFEYCEYFFRGHEKGPFMRQEALFDELYARNTRLKPLTRTLLKQLAKKFDNGKKWICYCHDDMPEVVDEKEIVECSYRKCIIRYFHRACVRHLGVNKVSKWYCTECEFVMQDLANVLLDDLKVKDGSVADVCAEDAAEHARIG